MDSGSSETIYLVTWMMLTAPPAPMTATSPVGQERLTSLRRFLLLITMYAPPYAFLMSTLIFGTVASAYAYINFAPCRIMPPYSCVVPGMNPGTSMKVTSGMLKASRISRILPLYRCVNVGTPRSVVAGCPQCQPFYVEPGEQTMTLGRIAHARCMKSPASTTWWTTSSIL